MQGLIRLDTCTGLVFIRVRPSLILSEPLVVDVMLKKV
jgi:hypothetical protein